MSGATTKWLPVSTSKAHKTSLIEQLPHLLNSIHESLQVNSSVLIYDTEGMTLCTSPTAISSFHLERDVCLCIAVAASLAFFSTTGSGALIYLHSDQRAILKTSITKDQVKKALACISVSGICPCPSRSNLKQIYNFFHKGSLLGRPSESDFS